MTSRCWPRAPTPTTAATPAPTQAAYYIAPGTTARGALDHDDVIYMGDMSRNLDVYKPKDSTLLLKLKLEVEPLKLK